MLVTNAKQTETPGTMPNDKIMKHFNLDRLPREMIEVVRPIHDAAHHLHHTTQPGPERSVALRKLLESFDAAQRAKSHPGS